MPLLRYVLFLVRPALIVACGGLLAVSGLAQTTVDREEQRRRAQQEAEERQLRQQAPDIRLQPQEAEADGDALTLPSETPCFQIDRLRLDGQRLDAFAWLDGYLARYAGRCIGEQGINLIARRASALIVARAYITTRLTIPEQDLTGGTLRFVLVPGVIRALRVLGDAPERNWRSAFPARPGDLLDLREIEQGLEQMKRLSSQEVSIDIAPGEAPGESDVVLTVVRRRPWRLGLFLDDSGVEATGRRQASLNVGVDNLLGLNDLLTVSVNTDAEGDRQQYGTRGYSAQYSLPWGYWTFSLAGSNAHYLQTIQGINQSFQSSGDTQNQEIKLQRLVYRDQSAKTTLQLRALRQTSHSYIEDTEILVQRRRSTAAELAVVHRHYLGAAQIDLALAYRQGTTRFGGQSEMPESDDERTSRAYHMQLLDVTASTPFSIAAQPLRWLATVHGQRANDRLDTADDIAIGNRYTVRGFDGERTLAAESGWYVRNELELPLTGLGAAFYAGVDRGQVSGPSAGRLAGRQLTGAVLGLRGAGKGFNYDVFVGWALAKPEGFRRRGR